MVDSQLRAFLEQRLAASATRDQILQELVGNGWQRADAENALRDTPASADAQAPSEIHLVPRTFEEPGLPQTQKRVLNAEQAPAQPSPGTAAKPREGRHTLLVVVGIIALLIIVCGGLYAFAEVTEPGLITSGIAKLSASREYFVDLLSDR